MHSSGSITRIRSASWMQSTGQTSTHERSLMSMQGSAMMYVTGAECTGGLLPSRRPPTLPSVRRSAFGAGRGEAASDGRRQLLDEVTRTLGQSRLDDDLVEAGLMRRPQPGGIGVRCESDQRHVGVRVCDVVRVET